MSGFNNLLPNGEGTLSADSLHQAREVLKRRAAGERINIQPDIVIQGATSGATARLSEIDFPIVNDNECNSYPDYEPGVDSNMRAAINIQPDVIIVPGYMLDEDVDAIIELPRGSSPTPPLNCCKLCGCKKDPKDLDEKNLCQKCADVEKLMGECFDKTGKVDLSGHVGQSNEMSEHFFQDDPPWPSHTAADEYEGYLVIPSCFPLEDYIFPFPTLRSLGLLQRALNCRAFTFERKQYTVRDIDFDEQIVLATRNS